ncbi:MAG: DNA-3-methyladenine glycosylase, partial [Armatimonadetes bacterium]|nr:DNA-3-methyladenine glycosylase [Armatimonadota bacterium]
VQIVEVEAYAGETDPGSHAFRGPTPRNQIMYGRAGHAYVYFCYGCHWMLNIVAGEEGDPSAVLVRAAMPVTGVESIRQNRPWARYDRDLLSGPGKLAQGLGITGAHNGLDLLDSSSLIRLRPSNQTREILHTTRIGLAKGKGEDIPWRFVDAELSEWASVR